MSIKFPLSLSNVHRLDPFISNSLCFENTSVDFNMVELRLVTNRVQLLFNSGRSYTTPNKSTL